MVLKTEVYQKGRWVSALMVATLLLMLCHGCRGGEEPVAPAVDSVTDTMAPLAASQPRASITFILGEDHSQYNQYYTLANHYYRLNPTERTDMVVTGLTSLQQVLLYLRRHSPADGRPFGIINLVSHGNQFVDLAMTISPGGDRTSAETLREAMRRKQIVPLDSTVVDSLTVVFLHGCAVGHNQSLLNQLAEAFGGNRRVTVKASKLFEYYAYPTASKNPQSIRHYYARVWYAFYRPDSAMSENDFVRQLNHRYPQDRVRWRSGLRRRFQEQPSDLYHYSFEVQCTWDDVYSTPNEIPAVNSRARRRQWVKDHPDFQGLMAKSQVPEEYFKLKFFRRTYQLADDSVAFGLHVRATAGVICLIQPLTLPNVTSSTYLPCPSGAPAPTYSSARSNLPFLPVSSDTTFFASSRMP